jgi:hypothetical protein
MDELENYRAAAPIFVVQRLAGGLRIVAHRCDPELSAIADYPEVGPSNDGAGEHLVDVGKRKKRLEIGGCVAVNPERLRLPIVGEEGFDRDRVDQAGEG